MDPMMLAHSTVCCGYSIRDFYEKPKLAVNCLALAQETYDLLPVTKYYFAHPWLPELGIRLKPMDYMAPVADNVVVSSPEDVDLLHIPDSDELMKGYTYTRLTGAMDYTIVVSATASELAPMQYIAPYAGCAMGEHFMHQGKDVLVLLTDMTSFADAMKEIAITMEQIPSNRGYPGDLYSQLASRYEKAVDFDGAGSITVLAVTTMPGDDVTHPVPDNTGYITEGQFYLRNGRIEPFGSLSRLKQQVNKETREDHRTIMDAMIKLYAQYKETLEKQSMGFRMSSWDKKLLKYGFDFEKGMMDLSVNIPLEEALDLGWKILADNFDKGEVGIPTKLSDKFWPKK